MNHVSHEHLRDTKGDDEYPRQDGRDSLFLASRYRILGTDSVATVRVRNLSSRGLMAELPNELDEGVKVQFEVRGIGWVTGKVAWSAAGRVGIAFDRPIDPLLARKPVGNGTATPVYTKPILPRR